MKAFGIPGLALGIVRHDSVIYLKAYGVRELVKPDRVTARTVFATGSTGKSFTALLVGMLVDEGVLGWDDRVVEHIPELRLHDPYLTSQQLASLGRIMSPSRSPSRRTCPPKL